MKKRILVMAAGYLTVFLVWLFVPEKVSEPAVSYEASSEEIDISFEVMTTESFIEKGADQRTKEESSVKREATRSMDISKGGRVIESKASEETGESVHAEQLGIVLGSDPADTGNTTVAEETWTEPYAETVSYETESQATAETVGVAPVEESGDTDIYGLLRQQLAAAGIEWWYPYAVAQMTQESHGNPWAENANGLDKGLFQFRITYWTEPESIFDISAQIRVYTRQVQARLAAGLSIEETISRHYTSDYVTEVNWEYVNLVLSHMH